MKYYASEIDKYAIQVTQKNFPDTIQLGNIREVKASGLPKIDLFIGGSPCQDVSFAGKGKGLIDGERSSLFFEFVRLYQELKPKYFILENVKMKKNSEAIITHCLGVQPIEINSSLFSAQNRKRLYWTNIPLDDLPKDKGIKLKDILENGIVDRDKSHCIDAIYFKGGNLKSYFEKHRRKLVFSNDGLCHVGEADINGYDLLKRVYHPEGKAPTLNSMGGGNREPKVLVEQLKWRKLTRLECERLQTVPDNYTQGVSNTQRYKMLGNGMTVDVIAFLLKNAKGIDNVLSCFDGMSCGQLALRRVQDGSL